MARLPRLHVPGAVHYLVQRAAGSRTLFVDADDGALLLDLLEAACRRHGFALHAYALTASGFQLLGTPSGPSTASQVLQSIGRAYVPRLNRRTGLAGALWDRRYRSTIVDPQWLLPVMRVIESASSHGAGGTPLAWTSHDHHVGARHAPFVTDHARYWALSDTPFGRQAAYRALTADPPDAALVARVQGAVEGGWALGGEDYVRSVEAAASRRPAPLRRGRPRTRKLEVSPE